MSCRRCDDVVRRRGELWAFVLTEVPLWFCLFAFGVGLGIWLQGARA